MKDLEALRAALREAGRFFAALRRRVQGRCEVCGAPFEGTVRRKYCSNRCASRVYRARHREELRRRRRERYLRAKAAKGG